MKAEIAFIAGMLVAGWALSAQAATGAPAANSPHYAKLAAQANSRQLSLFYLERGLVANVEKSARFGRLEGRYWALIRKNGAFPRAANFYGRLKSMHPDNAEILANYGNALGGLLGWLHKESAQLPRKIYADYGQAAMASYTQALTIQPDNFSALLGRAIFQSWVPGKLPEAKTGFKHILTLRKSRPHYPYAMVYRQWASALARHGKKERAAQIIQQGKAELGEDAFDEHASW